MRAWYAPAPSDTFKIPKSFVYIKMSHSTKSNFHARDSAINSLVVLLMRDLLTEYAYLGELAGLFYSLKTTRNGLEVSIRGYTSHIKEFVGRSGH